MSNGRDALTFLRKEGPYIHAPSPTLIILDLKLPKMDGDELLVELRRMPAYEETPVVIFSSADTAIAAPLAMGLGANEYVQKPSDVDAFFAAVLTMLTTWLGPGDS